MSNTLVFAYIGGSIQRSLYLRNNIPLTYILHLNLSLEYMHFYYLKYRYCMHPITMFAIIIL
ncbi:hypothetical protein [Clostridium butyricum]